MTTFEVVPVGPSGLEQHRARRVEVRSYRDLEAENAELRAAWETAHDARLRSDLRLNRAMRVLAALGRRGPQWAAAVEEAREEIWRLDRASKRSVVPQQVPGSSVGGEVAG